MRPWTGVIGAVMRVRNALAYATHTFFRKAGFMYVHAPLSLVPIAKALARCSR